MLASAMWKAGLILKFQNKIYLRCLGKKTIRIGLGFLPSPILIVGLFI